MVSINKGIVHETVTRKYFTLELTDNEAYYLMKDLQKLEDDVNETTAKIMNLLGGRNMA